MANIAIRRFDFDYIDADYRVLYAGEADRGVEDSDDRWTIWKYNYDANGKIASIEELHGAWDGRASLSWTA